MLIEFFSIWQEINLMMNLNHIDSGTRKQRNTLLNLISMICPDVVCLLTSSLYTLAKNLAEDFSSQS